MAPISALARPLTDPEIRQCIEERGARPARVQAPGSDTHAGLIRFDFPGHSGEQPLEAIGWDEWFEKFKESHLALLVQDDTATGQKRTPSRTVSSGKRTVKATGRSSRTGRKTTRAVSAGSNAEVRRGSAHITRSVQPRRKAA